jgi:RNA polymerase sigma-70 factor (ECF subfamily)
MTPALIEAAFLGALDDARRRAAARVPDLGGRLEALVQAAAATAPELPVDPAVLAADIAAHLDEAADVARYLERCRADELHLAASCARGDATAIALFERTFASDLDALARRFAGLDHRNEDLRQILRERLFVGDGDGRPPRIGDYAGQGLLRNWVRVIAVRTFINLRKRKDRAREPPVDDRTLLALPDPGDLELDFIKREYRAELARSLHEAARALEPGDRHLLRQHLAGGMSVDRLAAVYGIHRATAARRLARARTQLLDGVRAAMARRLGLGADELDSVMRLISSRLDASVAKLLATPPAAAASGRRT